MLRSTNPILTRQEAFTPAQPRGYGQPGDGQFLQAPPRTVGRMTIDDVIIKSAILFAAMMVVAAGTFFLMPLPAVFAVTIISALAGFVTSMIVAVRRRVSPVLTVAFSMIEGLFVGGMSKIFEMYYPGIVAQAVFGTFCAALVIFAAYKFLRVRITGTVLKVVIGATVAFAVAALLNLVLSLVGVNLGLYAGVTGKVSWLAWGFVLLGLVLASVNLIIDFQVIEDGINRGAPQSESWRAAFGLLVTMVWLYLQILRILSYIRR